MDGSGTVTLVEHREPSQQWAEIDAMTLQSTTETSFTLVFPIAGSHILLGHKRRGFGLGRMNGFGGKVQTGESIEEAAVRELEEECGLRATVSELEPRGHLVIIRPVQDAPPVLAQLFLFTCRRWIGRAVESDEMWPEWFLSDRLPFDRMWPEAPLYLPHLLKCHTRIIGKFQYVQGSEKALDGWWLGSSAQE